MAIIDVLKYDGPNDVLIWKWRSESNSSREQELRMGSQLIVNQSQEACFYKGGELLDVFGPGTLPALCLQPRPSPLVTPSALDLALHLASV